MASLRVSTFGLLLSAFLLIFISMTESRERRRRDFSGLKIGGQPTSVEEHPYMIKIKNLGRTHCSGSLVAPDCVVTAASCVKGHNMADFTGQGGETSAFIKGPERQILYYVSSYKYNRSQSNDMDIAILKLDKPLQGQHIEVISTDFTEVPANETVSISSWGVEFSLKSEGQLRTLNMTVMPWRWCAWTYRSLLTSNMFCGISDYKGQYTCDFGGAVVHNKRLVGVVVDGDVGPNPEIFTKFSSLPVKRFITDTIHRYCNLDYDY